MAEVLVFHPSASDIEFPEIDWGIIAPGSSADLQLRIYNESDYYTATGVVVSTPNTSGHYLSTDGTTFTASLALQNIAPRQYSVTITLRRVILRAATPGLYSTQISATAAAWAPVVS